MQGSHILLLVKFQTFCKIFWVKFQIFQSQALQMSCILNTGLIGVVNVHIRYWQHISIKSQQTDTNLVTNKASRKHNIHRATWSNKRLQNGPDLCTHYGNKLLISYQNQFIIFWSFSWFWTDVVKIMAFSLQGLKFSTFFPRFFQ